MEGSQWYNFRPHLGRTVNSCSENSCSLAKSLKPQNEEPCVFVSLSDRRSGETGTVGTVLRRSSEAGVSFATGGRTGVVGQTRGASSLDLLCLAASAHSATRSVREPDFVSDFGNREERPHCAAAGGNGKPSKCLIGDKYVRPFVPQLTDWWYMQRLFVHWSLALSGFLAICATDMTIGAPYRMKVVIATTRHCRIRSYIANVFQF